MGAPMRSAPPDSGAPEIGGGGFMGAWREKRGVKWGSDVRGGEFSGGSM